MEKKAIIIGAGPAGLTAAYKLLERGGIKPIILEKEDFVGGISRTVNYKGNRIDIGGHRFFSKSPEVVDLWKKLMPVQGRPAADDLLLKHEKSFSPGGPDPETKDLVFLIRRRVSRILYLRKFFDYPISLKFSMIANLGLVNTLIAGFSYIKAQMIQREEITLEDFMVNRFGKKLYQMFFKDYTHKVWGKYPNEISADWGTQRIKGLSLTKAVFHMLKNALPGSKDPSNVETSLIEQFLYPKFGPGQYWETMASSILESGGEVKKNAIVTRLEVTGDRINAVYFMEHGQERRLEGDYFISSMPLCELIPAIELASPHKVVEAAVNLPYRDFITVGLLVHKLKLKNSTSIRTLNQLVPDCWIYVQEPDVKIGRLQIFNNWSPYMVQDYADSVWIGLEYFCNETDEMWRMDEATFIQFAIDEVVRIGLVDKTDIMDSVQIKVPKAYPAYFGSYSEMGAIKSYLNQFLNLYCIGRNGQHRYNNMDHSMLTAFEAVELIFDDKKSTDALWDINAESAYHEEKESRERS